MFKESIVEDIYNRLGIDNFDHPLQQDTPIQKQQVMRYDEFLKNFGIYSADSFILDCKTSLN